jgi:hypothetical protein
LHDQVIRDLQPKLAVLHMFDGQGTADFLDQSPKQHQQIFLWITDYLKLISSGMPAAKLKGIQRDTRAEQTGPEMKHMGFTCAVSEFDGIEADVLKLAQTIRFGDLGIYALVAELPVPILNGAVVDDIVARCELAAIGTADLLRWSVLDSIHSH